MKVKNLENANGRAVANQFVIKDDNRKVFQSYDSTIVECEYNYYLSIYEIITIGYNWNYSRTTTKYLKMFLMDEIGLTDEEVETIKKQLRKENDCFMIERFIIKYNGDLK